MRLEVGFRLLADHDRPPYLSAGRVFTLLQECAQLPVKIRGKDGRWRVHKLADAGPPLAAHLLRATTRKVDGEIPPLQSWWMTAGRPILIFEACPRDLLELPPGSVAVEADRGSDFLLAYHSLQGTGNRPTAGVWFLEYDPGAELDRLRRLRIHLFRLHAEREALWKLLQELGAGGRLAFDRRSPSSWDLKCRLEKAARRLDQPRRFGLDQASILDCPGYKLNFIDEPSRAAMLRSLNDVAGRLELAGAPAHSA